MGGVLPGTVPVLLFQRVTEDPIQRMECNALIQLSLVLQHFVGARRTESFIHAVVFPSMQSRACPP